MTVLHIRAETMIARYRKNGLQVWQADRFAIALNKHPVEVWGINAWISTAVPDDLHAEDDLED